MIVPGRSTTVIVILFTPKGPPPDPIPQPIPIITAAPLPIIPPRTQFQNFCHLVLSLACSPWLIGISLPVSIL